MDDTTRMPVYCMAGHKFRLQLPSTYINKPIIDLKIYIQHERGFPTECQLVFICMDGKNFKALNDEELVPNLAKEGSTNTLHVYMKSASQTPNLVKTRQSDFDEWLKKLRELNISPHYDARPPAAAPDASTIHQSASNPLPLSQLPHTPARQLSAPQAAPRNIGAQRSAAFPTVLEDREVFREAEGAAADTGNAAMAASVTQYTNAPVQNVRKLASRYSTHSEHCQMCYRQDNAITPPTHYCFSCDYDCCVVCFSCVDAYHQGHDFEELEYCSEDALEQSAAQLPPEQSVRPPLQAPPQAPPSPTQHDEQLLPSEDPLSVEKWSCEACTLLNSLQAVHCQMCGKPRPPGYEAALGDEHTAAQSADESLWKWQCSGCTLLNLPLRPSCEACSMDRPANFEIPADYIPREEELAFTNESTAADIAMQQMPGDLTPEYIAALQRMGLN